MRWLGISTLLLATLLPLAAEDWTTEDGKTYKNITVLNQEDDGVRITYDGGVGKIPYYELSAELQKRFGQDPDSTAAKKHAIDKAIDDAVKSAASAEILKIAPDGSVRPSVPAPGPAPAPAPVAPAPSAAPSTTVAPAPDGTTPAAPGTATPGTAPGTAATVQPTPAPQPGAPAPAPTATSAAPGAPHPGVAAQPKPGMPQPNGAPGTAQASGPSSAPGAAPSPTFVSGEQQYPGAHFSYNNALDVNYLDSPTIDIFREPPKKGGKVGWSLMMRIVSDGNKPQKQDRIETTFLAVGSTGQYGGLHDIYFALDGTPPFQIDDSARKDTGVLTGGGQAVEYVTFYLTREQARKIADAKSVLFTVRPDDFKIDATGQAALLAYVDELDQLPPASSSILRSAYKALSKIPSFFSMLSTFCEYLIIGSFGLLLAASVAAFVLGISRFMKM